MTAQMTAQMTVQMTAPRLLLVGSGHASAALLRAAGRWRQWGARVTLLTPERFLFSSGMTPEYVGGVYREENARIDLLRLCLEGGAVRVDAAARAVVTAAGERLPFDVAVFDVGGAAANDAGAGNAVRVRPLSGLRRLSEWLEGGGGRLTVVGGGPAGVELLLNATARVRGRAGFTFTLLEPGPRLLGTFAPGLGRHAAARLRARGVESGGTLAGDLILWATGTAAQSLFRTSGLPVDEGGFLRVTRTLQVPGEPRLLAAGDAVGVERLRLDRSGVNAVKQGLHLRGSVARLLHGLRAGQAPESVGLRPFRPYPASPYLISTGEREGWLALGPQLWARGRPLLRLKHLADRVWISRYQAPRESVRSGTASGPRGRAG